MEQIHSLCSWVANDDNLKHFEVQVTALPNPEDSHSVGSDGDYIYGPVFPNVWPSCVRASNIIERWSTKY